MNSKYDAQPPGPWTAEWSKEFEEWVVLDSEGNLICWANGKNPKPILMTAAPALATRVEALENRLERLTPGGSEFHGNPERCLEFIQDAIKGVSSQVVKRKQAEARVEELKAALKPLVEAAIIGRLDLKILVSDVMVLDLAISQAKQALEVTNE